jgi:hypothetical protein
MLTWLLPWGSINIVTKKSHPMTWRESCISPYQLHVLQLLRVDQLRRHVVSDTG